MSRDRAPLLVALVGVSSPGYRSLATAYLREALKADHRLSDPWVVTPDYSTATDPWWIAYDLLSLDPQPDVIGFSVVCWNARIVYDVVRIVRAARPDVRIVLGGPEVGPIATQVLESHPGVDAVVVGEGERTLAELIHSWRRDGDPSSIPGVCVRDGGRVVCGPDPEPICDLDSLPSPFQAQRGAHATDGSAFVETFRGCPHRCGYCFEGKGSTRIRSFGWDRIAADIEAVASTPGMRSFSFIDPVFNLTPDRLQRLSDIMEPWARRGVRLHTIEVDIERIDDEQAALLARAGVVSVETGPQTTGARALGECARTFDERRFRSGIEACKRHDISVECDLIVGLPGDTADDIRASLDLVLSLDPGKVQMSTLHVLPGTDLWARADSLGLVYDAEPPHELIRTADIDYNQLRRLEAMGNAACVAYRARIDRRGPS